jgi:Spy/CpxP family protein refolding chaperone
MGGGPVGSFFAAADEAELKPEQKTKVEEIRKGLHGDGSSPRDDAKGFREELEAQVKVGKIEMAKLEPHLAAIEKSAKERIEKEDDALNKLYGALEPAQRSAVAAKVKAKQAERDARMAKRPFMRPGGGSQIARMTKNLELDDAQKKKVDALATKHEGDGGAPPAIMEADKRTAAIATAFEKDGFDAKKIEPTDPKKARAPFEAQAKLFADLLPILQPAQRDKLASQMDRAGHGGRHGRPGGGGHGTGGGDGDDDDDK